jgi:O-antigen ligase
MNDSSSSISQEENLVKPRNRIQNFSLLNWLALFMAFPVILIVGQNITVFLFLTIWLKFSRFTNLFRISSKVLLLPVFFGIGAVLSVLSNSVSVSSSLVVLPNYIYWCFLVIMLVNLNKYIELKEVSKFTAIGVGISVVYYIIQGSLGGLSFILNGLTPNSFSFILICFTTPAFIYLAVVKKSKVLAFIFLALSVSLLISEGRRAGTMLVLLPSIFALTYTKINVKKMALGFVIFTFSFLLLQTTVAEEAVQSLNPRIYRLVYESENIATEDFSFLVRRLQVEKALLVFEDYPFTGIGLNNFSDFSVNFRGDFEGSERVIKKEGMNRKSAHNSYVNILAEGGLFLIVPLLLLFSLNLYNFIVKYNKRSQIENAYYWSFTGMCLHLYFITAIVNVYAWFLIGIVTMLSVRYSGSKRLKAEYVP